MKVSVTLSKDYGVSGQNSQINVQQIANPMSSTAEAAPVLMQVVPAANLNASDFVALMAEKSKGRYDATACAQFVNSMVEVIEDLESTGPKNINLEFGIVKPMIAGSLETLDGAINPLVNTPYLGCLVDPALSNQVSLAVEATVPADNIPFRVTRVHCVEDATRVDYIDLGKTNQVYGKRLSMSDTGSACKLYDAAGTLKMTFNITKTGDQNFFQFACAAGSTGVTPGSNYRLGVTCKGAYGTELVEIMKPGYVTVVGTPPAIVNPTVTSMKDSGGNVVTAWPLSGYTDFCGTKLPVKGEEGISLKLTYMQGTTSHTETITAQMVDVGETGGAYFRLPDGIAAAIAEEIGTDRTCTFTMTNSEGKTGTFVTQLASA